MTARISAADVWQDLAAYKLGDESKAPEQLAKLVAETAVGQRGEIEQKLIGVLTSADATFDGKSWACRMLQRIGTEASIPALAKLLVEEKLSGYACLPLERMTDSAAAGKALRDALGKAPACAKRGIVASLGERADEAAVEQICALLSSSDAAIVDEALMALGKIGGAKAAKALDGAKVDAKLEAGRLDALLMCADKSGDAAIYAKVFAGSCDVHRVAALRGLIRADAAKACAIVVDALKGDDCYLRRGAMRLVVMEASDELTAAVAGAVKGLPVEKQAEVIGLLGERGDSAALGALAVCLDSESEAVRKATANAAAKLGGADQVAALLAAGESTLPAIASMADARVDAELIKQLNKGPAAALAVKALSMRGCVTAVPPILTLTTADDANVRKAAWGALAALATDEHADAMMKALLAAKDQTDKKLAEGALKRLCGTANDKNACFEVIAASYVQADDSTKALILDLGAIAGSKKALELAKGAMGESTELRGRAFRALAGWANADAAPALLELARNGSNEKESILALRGYIRVAGVDQRHPSWKEKLKMYQAASELAKRADEKRLILSGLRNVRRPEALKQLEACLSDEAVSKEAALAALDLGWDLRRHHREAVAAVSKKILETATDKGVIAKAKRNYNDTKPKK